MDQRNYQAEALCDAKYKDASPIQTVERIKAILREHQIETLEKWNEPTVPYCYSVRIQVAGTTFGVNGKGINREFTLASGYGELMERLQLGFLGSGSAQKDGSTGMGAVIAESVCAQDLLQENRKWYENLARECQRSTGQPITPEQILQQYTDSDGNVVATPFYCVTTGKKVYFPTVLFREVYVTNGCAAGNTMEEALVQGLSEIVERRHQLQVLASGITLPEISEDVLQKCTIAWQIITFLRQNGFRVTVKDCSMGSRFPVICVCLINTKTGRYHTHFGASPVFEIALERALTESFQGRTLDNIAKYDEFRDSNEDVFLLRNLAKQLTYGESEKTVEFFLPSEQPGDIRHMGFAGGNNRRLLQECVAYFRDMGLDILVRDCSCLGFPAYQIIVPGYSESYAQRVSTKHNDMRYWSYGMKVLRDPGAADLADLMGFMKHLSHMSQMPGNLAGVHGFVANAKVYAQLSPAEDAYLMYASMAHVNYTLGRYAEVIKYIQKMLAGKTTEQDAYLICVKRYFQLLLKGTGHEQIMKTLEIFHDIETLEALSTCLDRKENPLAAFVLRCDMRCEESCLLHDRCRRKQIHALSQLIRTKTRELDADRFADQLAKLLHDEC